MPSRFLQQHADAVVRREVVGGGPHDPLELGHRAVEIAGHEECGAEPVPQPRIVGIQLEPLSELRYRGRPFLPVERLQAAVLVGAGGREERVERCHQRVRGPDFGVLAPLQVLFGLRVVSQPAIGHPERVVHRADLRLARQDLLQQVGGPAVVLLEQRRLREAVARGERRRKQRQRLGEQPLGGVGPALLQADVAEPEQRRRILGLDAKDLLEEGGRLVQRTAVAVQLRQVVGPADVVGRQRRRLTQARLGLLGEPRRHEGHAHHADGLGRQLGGDARPLVGRRQSGMTLANLRLHRFAHAAQVRQHFPAGRHGARGGRRSDRRFRRRLRIPRRRVVRRGASDKKRREPQHRGRPPRRSRTLRPGRPPPPHQELPVPCSSVVHRSISTSSQVSVRPSGQRTSTAGRASDSPRPTITRGSFADA